MVEDVLWRRDADFPVVKPHPLPERADAVIVGGGYTGLSAARELARRGRSVVVLESGELGAGASARNAGFAHPGLRLGLRDLRHRYGALGIELYHETQQAMDRLFEVVASEGISCDLEPRGYLYLAQSGSQAAALRQAEESFAAELGRRSRLLAGPALEAEAGTPGYRAGLLINNAAAVQPARYLAGLARSALRAGADVHVRTPAVQVTDRGGEVVVGTNRGEVRARDALVATNGYSGGVVPWVQRRVIPIEESIVATEPLPGPLLEQVSPRRHLVVETKNFLCYWRTTADNRLIFGGRAGFAPATADETRDSLASRMRSRFPMLEQTSIDAVWSGNVAFTFDRLLHLKRRGAVMTAVACCGGGVALSGQLGARAAEWIAGGDEPAFAKLPFRTVPLYRGRPWFLRPVGPWLRLQDRIG
jgi:glycine/D-amino acid oxidase-like deaminating enzyme